MTHLAVVNARVHTLDADRPSGQAVLIRDGRIALVGETKDIMAARDEQTAILDCEGRAVVPGFVDGHAHVELTCTSRDQWIDATGPEIDSLELIAERIRSRDRSKDGRWIVCRTAFGLQHKVRERRLFTRTELDAIESDAPLLVMYGLHVNSLNSAGFRELGLLDGPPPPESFVHRDNDGTPSGVVTEVWDRLPPFPHDIVAGALETHEREILLANGITTSYTIPFSGEDVRALAQLRASGRLGARRRIYYHVPRVTSLDALMSTGLAPGVGDEFLRIGGVKIFVDGQGSDGLHQPLVDWKWSRDELEAFVARAHGAGFQLWMHAVTPEAVHAAAGAVAQATGGDDRLRHRIEHGADYLGHDDIEYVRGTGVRLVTTPQFLRSDDTPDSPSDTAPLRSLIDAGFRPIGGTDMTGTVPDGASPLYNIACAVARPGEQAITVDEALRCFTTWSAEGGFEEHEKGRIAPGLLGDLAVLSDDPHGVAPDRLVDIRVDVTVRGGEVVFER